MDTIFELVDNAKTNNYVDWWIIVVVIVVTVIRFLMERSTFHEEALTFEIRVVMHY